MPSQFKDLGLIAGWCFVRKGWPVRHSEGAALCDGEDLNAAPVQFGNKPFKVLTSFF